MLYLCFIDLLILLYLRPFFGRFYCIYTRMKVTEYLIGAKVNAGYSYRVNGYLFTVNAITSDGRLNVQVVDAKCQLQVLNDTTLENLHRVLGLNDPNEPVRHEIFQEVLNWLQMGEHVYLYGPAGTGKNVLAQQLAWVEVKELIKDSRVKIDYYFNSDEMVEVGR